MNTSVFNIKKREGARRKLDWSSAREIGLLLSGARTPPRPGLGAAAAVRHRRAHAVVHPLGLPRLPFTHDDAHRSCATSSHSGVDLAVVRARQTKRIGIWSAGFWKTPANVWLGHAYICVAISGGERPYYGRLGFVAGITRDYTPFLLILQEMPFHSF